MSDGRRVVDAPSPIIIVVAIVAAGIGTLYRWIRARRPEKVLHVFGDGESAVGGSELRRGPSGPWLLGRSQWPRWREGAAVFA